MLAVRYCFSRWDLWIAPLLIALLLIALLLIALGAGLSAGCSPAWIRDQGAMDRSDLPLRFSKIKGYLYLAEDYNYWKTNSVLYLHPEGSLFFDTNWSYKGGRQLLWRAAVLSQAPFRGVAITSFLPSRTGGLNPFQAQGVPLLMHKSSLGLLQKYWEQEQERMSSSFSTWRRLDYVTPNALFGETFYFLDGSVEVLHVGPAHTPDSSVVFFPQERLLYGGSLLAHPLQRLEYIDLAGYERALEKIAKLPFETIIAGHGRALHNRDLLRKVELQIKQIKQMKRLKKG